MPQIFFFLIFIIIGCKTTNTINNGTPIELKSQGSSVLYLEKFEIHPSYTKLNFTYHNTLKANIQGGISFAQWIGINANVSIFDNENLKSYKFIKAKRISISPAQITIRSGEKYSFSLIFQKIEKFTKKIDIIECENNANTNCWNFYNISLENDIVEYFEN